MWRCDDRATVFVGCETIYAFIYRAAQKAEQLWRCLTRRHKRRRPRRSRPSRDTIKDRVSIHERPENIDARTEAGHWEGDLIICKRTRPVLVLHERKSRVTLAARLVGKTAAETISVMLAVFARIEPTLRKSITFDNDTAFAQHARLKTMCAMTTWFCDAYASWQKGGVENANGRLRRWLPRQIDIDKVSDEEIQDIILTANLTPKKKCLGFKTPFPGDPQRAWQRRPNTVFINPLHLAPESTYHVESSVIMSPNRVYSLVAITWVLDAAFQVRFEIIETERLGINEPSVECFFHELSEFAQAEHGDGALPPNPDIALRLRYQIHKAVAEKTRNHLAIDFAAQHEHEGLAHARPNEFLSERIKNDLENWMGIAVKHGGYNSMRRLDESVANVCVEFM